MVRAVRLAATLGFEVEPDTLAALREQADLVAHLSGERIWAELAKLLDAPVPSVGLRLAEATGLLAAIAPDLAAQRGVPQNKVPGEDLWDHTLRTVDAAPAGSAPIRLAALVHDIGKPSTFADGHFHHHEVAGARLAEAWLRRLRVPRALMDEVVLLVRHHMFDADPGLSGAAIRRFLRRVGPENVDALLALRRADDIGSGLPPDDARLAAFRARVDAELAAQVPLDRTALAVDGDDLMRELGLEPGPRLGRVLDELLERTLTDPALNDRATLVRARTGHPCGHGRAGRRRMIELLLEAERALAMGRVDQAERLYRQSADADPRNSIAVVGLARVALERGDEPGAWRLARRALDIDPENVAAQRLAQRLEEVWAYRGESLAEAAAAARGRPSAAASRRPPCPPRQWPSPPRTGPPRPNPHVRARTRSPPSPPAAAPSPSEPAARADTPSPAAPAAVPHRSVVDRLLRRNRP